MNVLLVAVALGALLAACQAAPPIRERPMVSVAGPGWSAGVPAELGLQAFRPTADGAAFVRLHDNEPGVTLEILRNGVGIDESLAQLSRPGAPPILRQEPVAMPSGRAVYLELGPGGRAARAVLAEPRAGVLLILAGSDVEAVDLVTIARTVRVDE